MRHLFTLLYLFTFSAAFSQINIDVTAVGASTSRSDNSSYIQQAIDSVANNGGGEVIINGGSFTSNTIILKSNVTLRVTTGSTLLAIPTNTFPHIVYNIPSWMDTYADQSLIFAEDAHNIRITGGGTIDGNGTQLVYLQVSNIHKRPMGMRFHGVNSLQIDSINLRQAPQWIASIDSCQHLHIFNVNVYNQGFSQNDGIDISCCTDVLVENSTFDTGDDPLPIKTEGRSICRDVMVRNCTFATFERAVKVGCETLGPIVNVHFQDITVVPSANTVVGAVSVPFNMMYIGVADGGSIDSVYFQNINGSAARSYTSLFIRLCDRGFSYDGTHPGPFYLRNVFIDNVVATQTSAIPNSITGIPGFPVQNINVHNVVLTVPGGGALGYDSIGEQIATRPEYNIWGDSLPAYGLFVRHANNVNLDSFCIILQSHDQRPEFYEVDTASMTYTSPCSSADPNGIKNGPNSSGISFYPNPAKDQLNIQNIPAECEVIVFIDMRGSLVAVVPVRDRTEMPINTASLESGVYTAIANGANYHQVTKVVIAK